MSTAYTPGLRISSGALIRKARRLPLKGEILVKVGDEVQPETIVARTEIPGMIYTVKVAEELGLEPADAIKALIIKQGDTITVGQTIAKSKSFFGLFTNECKSPMAGIAELITEATGHVGVRTAPRPVEVDAYVKGRVVEIIGSEGVVIESFCAIVQGIFGIGGERSGTLVVEERNSLKPITENSINPDHAGCVLVGKETVTAAALRKASEIGVKGIVVGAIADTEMIEYLGHDIGVAITGQEEIGTTLILTEGFGSISMADSTYKLLNYLKRERVSINGATQIRAGVIRPDVICTCRDISEKVGEATESFALEIGTKIRMLADPYFGKLAWVYALPSDPVEIETGSLARVLVAELPDGTHVGVPRANVEIIKE